MYCKLISCNLKVAVMGQFNTFLPTLLFCFKHEYLSEKRIKGLLALFWLPASPFPQSVPGLNLFPIVLPFLMFLAGWEQASQAVAARCWGTQG